MVARLPYVLSACVVVLLALSVSGASAQNRTEPQEQQFGADYDTLSDLQRALVDDLYKRASAIIGKTLDPKTQYDSTRLSVRTTFDAVTHALTRSELTDRETGESLGAAIGLIDYVEAVEGQVKGAPGDQQFRLYVTLKSGAEDKLQRSREFRRTADNTVFHKGYPKSYRQGGYPSVQFSIVKDGTRADIDVDYRSSSFPAGLVNGHLTAANSDVRAGNLDRHNGRWSGLVNWWEGFFSVLFAPRVDEPEDKDRPFPIIPRAGSKTIDVAVRDFLTSWLVEGRPDLSVAYADADAYNCLAMQLDEEGLALDRGLAPLQLYARMKRVSDMVGPRNSLEGTTRGVRLTDQSLKIVRHDHPDQYSIYAVPESMAAQMSCGNYSTFGVLPQAASSRMSREAYESFYSTFTIVGPNDTSTALGLLWQRRDGQWKVTSYQRATDDIEGSTIMPDIRAEAPATEFVHMKGDPSLIAASEKFLDDWLVRKRYDDALAAISPECYACVNLYLDPGEASKTTAEAQRAALRASIERVGRQVGRVVRLEDVIKGVEPTDPRLRIVDQPRSKAFTLLALPDSAGTAAECQARLTAGDVVLKEDIAAEGYGQYFASALKFETKAGDPAVLFLGWKRENGRWRIFAYKVMEP